MSKWVCHGGSHILWLSLLVQVSMFQGHFESSFLTRKHQEPGSGPLLATAPCFYRRYVVGLVSNLYAAS
jgi:hypothetical protein